AGWAAWVGSLGWSLMAFTFVGSMKGPLARSRVPAGHREFNPRVCAASGLPSAGAAHIFRALMIERYTLPEMAAIWTDQRKYEIWLEIETLACEAQAELGHIPKEDARTIREKAKFN